MKTITLTPGVLIGLFVTLSMGCGDDTNTLDPTTAGTGGDINNTAGTIGSNGTGGINASNTAVGGKTGGTQQQPVAGGTGKATGGKGATTGGAAGGAGTKTAIGGTSGTNADTPDTTGPADFSKFKDPGKGPWAKGTPAECKMDPTKFNDSGLNAYAVFRYGKLCHMKGNDAVGQMYSATKTLGGVMSGRAAYVAHDVKKSGPGTGPIVHADKGTDWIATPSYSTRNPDATISHIMAMVAYASPSLQDDALTFSYDTVGLEAINNMIQASEKSFRQVQSFASLDAVAFVQQEIFDKLGMEDSAWPGGAIATGWTANMSDMGKLGFLMLHDGWYGGERLISQEWMYRMSHPGFESANTSYGQLAWLNHRGNAAGIGGNITSGSNAPEGDPCAPACFWSKYPHPPSEAKDCMATAAGASCQQKYDVGIYSAQGLGGQFVVMHPGLDLVMVAQNFSGGDGPMGMWAAVRPGLVAMDPKYKGDEEAFCKAYGAGEYAPDLVVPRWKPTF